jgi:hypothetical protein
MKANRLKWLLVFLLVSAAFQLPAQQSEADHKLLAEVRAEAERGDAQSQLLLGGVFDYGLLGVAKDEAEAAKWWRKAAEQNHVEAQCCLGFCYKHGHGVARDEAEAVKWYRKAAQQNYSQAQRDLGRCYYFGQGLAKDYVEAVKWWRKAAEQNPELLT